MNHIPDSVHLCAGGVSVVFAVTGERLPRVVYWGDEFAAGDDLIAELIVTSGPAVVNSSFDRPRDVSIAPTRFEGWSGTPGIAWHAGERAASRLVLESTDSTDVTATFTLRDELGTTLVYDFALSDSGLLRGRARVENGRDDGLVIDISALRVLMPVPDRAREVLDFTGRWSGERRPQRRPIGDGTWLRATRRGRPGHDSPYLTVVGAPGFGFGHGEVWAMHTAWSGSQEHLVEHLPEGAGVLSTLMGGGEVLEPGDIRLGAGDAYESPDVFFAYSRDGIDSIAQQFHRHLRAGQAYPSGARPLVLNTWEAVYFNHDFHTLNELAIRAAEIGVERFVLDDGWFRGRRDDKIGLGDWFVDDTVWADRLSVLAERVHALGMEFGLWFEPEMVNLDSDLVRAHPDWILGDDEQHDLSWRHQFVLNLAHPEAWEYLRARINDVITTSGVDFIKWDHNRDLHAATDRASHRTVMHEQTVAVYRLMDTLRRAHPGLEIESCASGGARVDLGMMQHTQRVWASDTNDPVERQAIHRATALLLPPELIGVHVGPEEAHTTHRVTNLPYRLTTALFGHAGIEWDITHCSDDELASLASWAELYKELRPLLHSGVTVNADDLDDGAQLSGVVAQDGAHALFSWSRIHTSSTAHTPRVRIPGLDPRVKYSVRVRDEIGRASMHVVAKPSWMPEPGEAVVLSGHLLTEVGVPLPILNPANAMLIEFRRAESA